VQSVLSCAIAPESVLREAPLTLNVSSTSWWQTWIYLVRIPRPFVNAVDHRDLAPESLDEFRGQIEQSN
jgi:hypothetical protein